MTAIPPIARGNADRQRRWSWTGCDGIRPDRSVSVLATGRPAAFGSQQGTQPVLNHRLRVPSRHAQRASGTPATPCAAIESPYAGYGNSS